MSKTSDLKLKLTYLKVSCPGFWLEFRTKHDMFLATSEEIKRSLTCLFDRYFVAFEILILLVLFD